MGVRADTRTEGLGWVEQSGRSAHNSCPSNSSSSPPGDVAGGGGPPAGDLWTAGPDCWSALRGPGVWATLVGKILGRGLQGEEPGGMGSK